MSWFERRGLRVLMYHKISSETGDALTVTAAQLEGQMKWLIEEEYAFVTGNQLIASILEGKPLPANSVLVTFDDAYVNNFELAFPILKKLAIPSVLFVPTAFIGGTSSWDVVAHPLMDEAQLRLAGESGVELALHSHHHVNYEELPLKHLAEDVQSCLETFLSHGLPFVPLLAYPFGRRPEKKGEFLAMVNVLAKAGVKAAFRIGNRINPLPLKQQYEIQRLGVRGDESMKRFERKIRRGRLL